MFFTFIDEPYNANVTWANKEFKKKEKMPSEILNMIQSVLGAADQIYVPPSASIVVAFCSWRQDGVSCQWLRPDRL
ncbi:hypothetical protein TNIN_443841 [Trichonephila inaurata madagascariensis]|uniref:Uncharacterized protein n=1 Tax=Trichonephila inaurata madagascariensis TaxID=2747483 RepID=A0A8X6I4Y6_9ARAC|nr:hypothetical protein TNIN_443841 [Trichonephila inaurata madagascariensis]